MNPTIERALQASEAMADSKNKIDFETLHRKVPDHFEARSTS